MMSVKILPMAEWSQPLLLDWKLTCDPQVLVQDCGNYFMLSFDKAVSMYITTDDDFCFVFVKKFIRLSNLSNMYWELPVGVCIQVNCVC